MTENVSEKKINDLEDVILQRMQLEEDLELGAKLLKFMYDLSYEAYWMQKDMCKWRYKTIKEEDISHKRDEKQQKTTYSFEHKTNFYTSMLRITENKTSPRAFIDILREEKLVFSAVLEKDDRHDEWFMKNLDAFILTDKWYEEILETADIFNEEWKSIQKKNSDETTLDQTMDKLKQGREYQDKFNKFLEE